MIDDAPARREFGIMGTFAELILRASAQVAEPLFDEAVAELTRLEAMLTRFDPSSPIEQINDHGHGIAGAELQEILEASLVAFHDTDGRVDVGIGADLIRAGYDRDFDLLDVPSGEELDSRASGLTIGEIAQPGAVREPGFSVDSDGVVSLCEGVRVDLGGIAKGWASDRVCGMLAQAGSCVVNLGGDIALHVADGDESWPIGIELAEGTQSFAIAYGGLATSGQDRRVWRVPGENALAHHVIDPRTARPAQTDILRITVISSSCLQAEVWAKALFLRGCDAACEEARERDITAIIIGADGGIRYTGALA